MTALPAGDPPASAAPERPSSAHRLVAMIVGPPEGAGTAELLELLGGLSSARVSIDTLLVEARHGPRELLDALRATDLLRPPDVARPAADGSLARLSPRERDVLALIAQGLTNQEIGARLSLSANTVKTYIRAGYSKIGAERRSDAVSWMWRHAADTLAEGSPATSAQHPSPPLPRAGRDSR